MSKKENIDQKIARLLQEIQISDEMETSYLDYSMSVIVSRALPDVRDGLKPVHRRILYAMDELKLGHSAKFRKSATVVGHVLGRFHPHGDVAVYDSMVRMAQDFAMRYPLIKGHGNFGSVDGDAPAAMRYTESKMAKISSEMLKDIKMETVDFVDNYDGTVKEPVVLPARIPNLLLNGSLGIAVGMATNIPPHNLGEVIDATIALLEDSDLGVEDLMKYIKGPDFPTGASIYGTEGIRQAYSSGKGRIVIRGRAKIEEGGRGRYRIIITEIPFQVNKAELLKKIADLVKSGRIEGISDLRDESDRQGMRVVVELKKSAYPRKVLNALYKYSRLQDAFHINLLALVDGLQPRVLTLKEILKYFLKHRHEVIRRRSKFELRLIKARLHILKGLMIALAEIDRVIKTIKESKNRNDARKRLILRFKLTTEQAEAILDMRLSQLSALERGQIEEEYKNKQKRKKELEELLASEVKLSQEIKKELLEIKEEYQDERRTRIFKKADVDQIDDEDIIPDEPTIITITRDNYIKRLPITTYKSQGRGGKGVIGMMTKEEDVVERMMVTNTHSNLLFFTDQGKVYQLPVYQVPETTRQAKGQAIVNILQVGPREKVTGVIDLKELEEGTENLLMATEQGRVKKTKIREYQNIRQSGLIAIRLKEEDRLKWVKPTSGSDNIILVSAQGKSIRFREEDVRPMARNTQGVKGIELNKNDRLIGMDVIASRQQKADQSKELAQKDLEKAKGLVKEDVQALIEEAQKTKKGLAADLLIVTTKGYGKRSRLKDYPFQKRGGKGVKTANVKPKTGDIVQMMVVPPRGAGDLMIVSAKGKVIRIPISSAKKMGRDTQGVRLMTLDRGDQVASVTLLAKK